jgi:hypothetical protein
MRKLNGLQDINGPRKLVSLAKFVQSINSVPEATPFFITVRANRRLDPFENNL